MRTMMTDEHVTFDEMTAFFFPEKPDADYRRLASRVNAHLMGCPSCRKRYDALLDFSEETERSAAAMTPAQQRRMTILRALYGLRATSDEMAQAIDRLLDRAHELTASVCVRIRSFGELSAVGIGNGLQYRYPVFSTVPKAAGEAGATTGISKSSVVADDRSRISIGLDGTLSLYFDRSACSRDAWVLLAPTGEGQIPYYKPLEAYDERQLAAHFFGITPGEYLVILQNQR